MIRNYTDHAANERTFLAWVRTTIAVVGFGIAGARLGITSPQADPKTTFWLDALILGAGALVVALAYVRMRITRARIDSTEEASDEASPADAMLAVLVIAFFALLASFGLRLSL